MIQKLRAYLFSNAPLQTRIFYIVAASAMAASLMGALSAVCSDLPYVGSLLAAGVTGALMLFMHRSGNTVLSSYLLIIFINYNWVYISINSC